MKNKLIGLSFIAITAIVGITSCSTSNASEREFESKLDISSDGDGEELFKKVCTQCHRTSMPSGKEEMQSMLAPPIMGVMFHVNDGVIPKEGQDKRDAVIDFIVDYAHNPSADKSFCEKHAIERFGVMPTQKENITKEELILVANYLYEAYPSGSVNHDELQKKMGMEGSEKEGCKDGKKGCKDKKKGCNH
jgi:hypothetical protein